MAPSLTLHEHAAREAELIACRECDLLQRAIPLPARGSALCRRCGAVLYRARPHSLDRTLAYTLAAVVMFALANSFPIVVVELQGHRSSTTLLGAALTLHRQDMSSVALLVFATTVLLPALQLAAMLGMLLPLRFGRVPAGRHWLFRVVAHAKPWAMVEVFLLGTLVSIAKLAHMASLKPDVALWSFAALIVLLALAASSLDERLLWRQIDAKATP